jgi:streptogramin lyase
LWFSFPGGIGSARATGNRRLYQREPGKSAWCPTPDGQGRVWFLDRQNKSVGWITTDGTFSAQDIALGSASRPSRLVLAPWGEVCVSSGSRDTIFAIAPDGSVRTFTGESCVAICAGPERALWSISSMHLTAVTEDGTTLDRLFLGPERRLETVTSDNRDGLWIADSGRKAIVHRKANGAFFEYQIGLDEAVFALAADPADGVWCSTYGNRGQFIGRLRENGEYTTYLPPSDDPMLLEMAIGPDGLPWVIDNWLARLIRIG